MEKINARIHGLDILRSVAILLVLMMHYTVFVSHQSTFGIFSEIGWVGVDLFFVLSGYLIGNQIFNALKNQQGFSFKQFYYRRLLRTLPNYLAVLSMYFLIHGFSEYETISPLWKFLTFTQNLGLHIGTAFSHAWSLCIEEQFYLVLPVLAITVVNKKTPVSLRTLFGGLLIAGIILRACLWMYCAQYPYEEFKHLFYSHIYYASYCRLDELIMGVGIAVWKNFHARTWEDLTAKGNWMLLFGLIGSSMVCYGFAHHHYSFFMTAFGYPLLAISFAALTIAALSPNSYFHRMKIPGASTLAVWSYAIYLIHKPISVLVYHALARFGIEPSSLLAVITVMLSSIGSGYLLYTVVEVPFLRIRDRLNFARNTLVVTAKAPINKIVVSGK